MHDFYLPSDKGGSTMMICDAHKQRIHDGMIITVVVSSSRKTQIILREKNMFLPTPRFI